MSDGAHQTGRGECVDHPLARLHGVRDGLLDKGVHPGGGELEGSLLVEPGGDCHHGQIDSGRDQRVDIREDRQVARDPVWIAPRVGDRDQFDAVHLAEDPGVVPAHHPDAQEAGAQIGHQAPAPARALTAVTMRSRSPALSEGCTGNETTSDAARSVSGSSSPGAYGASEGRRWFGIG